jgi:hypothetical protein
MTLAIFNPSSGGKKIVAVPVETASIIGILFKLILFSLQRRGKRGKL